jgi:Membrane protein implicated in regulation of membrane protease activity
MIVSLINSLGPWSWVVGGVLLVLLELAVPGVFLIWLGLAAIATGVVDFGLDLSWQVASLVFCVLSAAFVFGGRMLSQRGEPNDETVGLLNHRARRLVGQVYVLDEPIVRGEGRVRIGDSSWRIVGHDAPAGSKVKVIKADGTTLVVERQD